MVTLADIPSAAELIRESRITGELFYREVSGDRPMFSANDWYGYGYIAGLLGNSPRAGQRVRWYCGENGAYEQFYLGMRHAQESDIKEAIG